jgi:hypothetical protein
MKKDRRVPGKVRGQIELALEHLHDNGFAFGDLRPSNMVTKNGEVKLIGQVYTRSLSTHSRCPLSSDGRMMSRDYLLWKLGMTMMC